MQFVRILYETLGFQIGERKPGCDIVAVRDGVEYPVVVKCRRRPLREGGWVAMSPKQVETLKNDPNSRLENVTLNDDGNVIEHDTLRGKDIGRVKVHACRVYFKRDSLSPTQVNLDTPSDDEAVSQPE